MTTNISQTDTQSQPDQQPSPKLTLDDLLKSESEALRRIARDAHTNRMAGHNSSTNGHNSSGVHNSHSSAKLERPLE